MIGRQGDVAVLRYVFAFAEREIDRLARRAVTTGEVRGRTGGNNYRHGAVRAVVETMEREQERTRVSFVREHGARGQTARVKIDESAQEVERWMRHEYPRTRKYGYGGARDDKSAQAAGYRDGKRIQVGTGLGSGGRACAALPGR